LPTPTPGAGGGSGIPPSALGSSNPLGTARDASSSGIVLPVVLVVAFILGAFAFLAIWINPGADTTDPVLDRRTYWYSGLATSDKRLLAPVGRSIARTHRMLRTVWRRSSATAAWLLGR
jgi:hypothetical protein